MCLIRFCSYKYYLNLPVTKVCISKVFNVSKAEASIIKKYHSIDLSALFSAKIGNMIIWNHGDTLQVVGDYILKETSGWGKCKSEYQLI